MLQREDASSKTRTGIKFKKKKQKKHEQVASKPCCAMRYFVSIMLGLGLFQVYCMRVNLSVAVQPISCQYELSNPTSGLILSSFFWGYLLGQIPGGYLSIRYGGKLIFGIGVFCTSICTLLLPLVASHDLMGNLSDDTTCQCSHGVAKEWSFKHGHFTHHKDNSLPICSESGNVWLLIFLRVLTGIFEAPSYPAFYSLIEIWAPESEKSFLLAIGNGGSYLGTLCAFPLSSYILVSTNWYGYWPYIFYLFGFLGVVWSVAWFLLVPFSPKTSKAIHPLERELILTDKSTPDIRNIPWKLILSHKAFWANYCGHMGFNWVLYTLLTYLPTYLNKRLNFDMGKSGFLTSGPYIGLLVGSVLVGRLADACIKNKWLPRHRSRQVFQFISFVLSGASLVTIGFVNNRVFAVILVISAQTFTCFSQGGFSSNYLDVSRKWMGVVYGVGNFFGTIPGIISPILTGLILGGDSNGSQHDWIVVFLIGAFFLHDGYCIVHYIVAGPAPFCKRIHRSQR